MGGSSKVSGLSQAHSSMGFPAILDGSSKVGGYEVVGDEWGEVGEFASRQHFSSYADRGGEHVGASDVVGHGVQALARIVATGMGFDLL